MVPVYPFVVDKDDIAYVPSQLRPVRKDTATLSSAALLSGPRCIPHFRVGVTIVKTKQ